MKLLVQLLLVSFVSFSTFAQSAKEKNKAFTAMLDKYYTERMKMLPMESTSNGEPGNNDKLYAEFTDSYRAKLKAFFTNYKKKASMFKRADLNKDDQLSHDIFIDEMNVSIDGINLGFFSNSNLYPEQDRKSTRLNSSHSQISYAVFCLKKKNK